jgi:hypothetical protein
MRWVLPYLRWSVPIAASLGTSKGSRENLRVLAGCGSMAESKFYALIT